MEEYRQDVELLEARGQRARGIGDNESCLTLPRLFPTATPLDPHAPLTPLTYLVPMKKTLRTFVAVEITGPIRARTKELIAALAGTTADVKWVEPHNLHLTLKFLGDVHQNDIVRVCQAVPRRGRGQTIRVGLARRRRVSHAARPRTVWLGRRRRYRGDGRLARPRRSRLGRTGLP